ncbi:MULTISPECIES: dermonecrotic toxin domain-containing protein [Pseudomonas]|uniref:dermonecrotic toxin domain-containing protein n=1 Tax=Pseudomonas TaxID=286 RepID=UPI001BE61E97|nr:MULTISPECIES: DUF6543 domain-containing protein [Pseudomonas]MBT2340039.1 hypothetical protein [Pseudomonas fluorescens]MCD4527915.1 hypothetical protein [Pseudomonas sp. C3-2018]
MTSPAPADSASALALTVSLQFASRPTFEQVARRMLEQAIQKQYPSLSFDLSQLQLATPNAADRAWRVQPFMPRVLDYLALGTPWDFRDAGGLSCFLSERMPHPLRWAERKVDMQDIKKLLTELPWTAPIGLQDALTGYWNAEIDGHDGVSRWRWFSDVLKNVLQIRGLQQPGLTDQAREALDQIVRWPDRDLRFFHNNPSPVYAYSLETVISQGGVSSVLIGSEILLAHLAQGATLYLLCSPGSAVQSFSSLEAFNRYWSTRIASQYVVDTITCQRNEIGGNAFDVQAAMILEQQLADLQAVQLPARIGLQALTTLYQDLSDPARYLLDAPRLTPEISARLEPLLPAWLKNASSVDRTHFQHLSLTVASAKQRSLGRTYLSDVQDIKAFTADALVKQMQQTNDNRLDRAPPSHFHPDDVELTFTVAAGYPGTVGIIEKKTMSLTDLAIHNLVARPSANLVLGHRLGLALPAWLTPDFITRKNGLIEQVDIGATYPRYLQQRLVDDLPHARQRQRMFTDQMPAQLQLEALQHLLEQKNGMTRPGLRLLAAVLQPDVDGQKLDGRAVTIRHLAFLCKPGAQPDIVTNMFMIEPQDVSTGPHLLYRPLYSPALQEYPTRQALLQAIVTPGDLQESILTWMSDTARRIYADGGFVEPHIVRFFQGDEFSLPAKPAPATLAVDDESSAELQKWLRNGDLMPCLYRSNAHALVTQADRDSVSNSESRWAVLLEGGNLIFNSLLMPLLRGPVMATAWLWNLMASASHDIPALSSQDPVARELAAVDLLVNLGMLVSQFPAIRPVHLPVPEAAQQQAMRTPAPRVIPEQWPAPPPPSLVEQPAALPGKHSATASGYLDFGFANARHRLTSAQHNYLLRVQLPRPASLPEAIGYGPNTGLYVIANRWHALVEDRLYQVSPETDGSVTIVDPRDPNASGPPLKSDGQGNWSLDLRLRLRGGMPPKRVEAQRRINLQRVRQLTEEHNRWIEKDDDRQKALDVAQQVMTRTEDGNYTEAQRAQKRKTFYDLLQEQTEIYLKMADSAPERASLGIGFPPGYLHGLMENVINNARKAFLITQKDYVATQQAHPQFHWGRDFREIVAYNLEPYRKYLDTMSDINDRAIHWLELKDDYLERLLNLDPAGAQAFERLTRGRPLDERNAIGSKTLQLSTLPILSVKNLQSSLAESLLRIVMPLAEQMRSHHDLRMYDLPASEQLEVLASLTEQYGKTLDALRGTKALYPDDINETYFDRLINLVEGLYQEVSGKLAAEIKPEPTPRKRAPKHSKVSTGHLQKKVIKTRHSGVLIGDLKPAGTRLPIDVVELRSEADNQLLATYSQHDDVWDVVDTPRPAPVPSTRSIRAVKGDARRLLEQLENRLASAERYKIRCRFPQEIEEIMNNEGSRYRKLTEELERALTASTTPRTAAEQTLLDQLSDAVSRLSARGSELRTELSLKLPPTDSNLRYLFDKDLIQVARLGDRTALKGPRKDFLQEYAINDRDGRPLWYAHFHYETADTPKADFSVAHLKNREQRMEHYYSMLARANSPYAVVNVHRGQIGRPLAQRRFLPLAP